MGQIRKLISFAINCSDGYSTRNLKCDDRYRQETENAVQLHCSDGTWDIVTNGPEDALCSPICVSACLNGGLCTAPDTCTCSSDYFGEFCQFKKCKEIIINKGTLVVK